MGEVDPAFIQEYEHRPKLNVTEAGPPLNNSELSNDQQLIGSLRALLETFEILVYVMKSLNLCSVFELCTIEERVESDTTTRGNSKTLLIVNVCPNVSNLSETLSALKFAGRAQNSELSLGNRDTIKKWRDV
ncbi:hypothetical protein IFM89_002156, partial [Coptis chinensis]